MRIRNNSNRPLVVALRDCPDRDDYEELLQPGQVSNEFYNITDEWFDIEEPEGTHVKDRNALEELCELCKQCSTDCRICQGHLQAFKSLDLHNPDDLKLYGLISGNLRRHLKTGKHRN